eukprot:366074-Chlamydomonas_euryale.AAC.3
MHAVGTTSLVRCDAAGIEQPSTANHISSGATVNTVSCKRHPTPCTQLHTRSEHGLNPVFILPRQDWQRQRYHAKAHPLCRRTPSHYSSPFNDAPPTAYPTAPTARCQHPSLSHRHSRQSCPEVP